MVSGFSIWGLGSSKRAEKGTPNRAPQEYNRNIIEYKDPGRYTPIIFLVYSWGSLFGVPSKVSLFRVSGSGFRMSSLAKSCF